MGIGPIGPAIQRQREAAARVAAQQAQQNRAHGRTITPAPGAIPQVGGQGGPTTGPTTRLGGSSGRYTYSPNRFSSQYQMPRTPGPMGPGSMPTPMAPPQNQAQMGMSGMPGMQQQMAQIAALRGMR